jgi:uncharacterized protein YecE (DUF72 family)
VEIRIGTSGWSYKDWVGVFYPEGTRPADYLPIYAERFSTVEVDSTWYGVPRSSTVRNWAERTPPGFLFAAKFPRDITHEASLEGCEPVTDAFLGTMSLLEEKCGPLLLQFPYGFKAERYDDLLAYLDTLSSEFRYVVEVRHRSWLATDLSQQLADRSIALCLIDHPWFPRLAEANTDFIYVRWLGDRKKIEEDFSHERDPRDADFGWWIENLQPLAEVRRLFGYVNNHYTGFGPAAAQRMIDSLEAA